MEKTKVITDTVIYGHAAIGGKDEIVKDKPEVISNAKVSGDAAIDMIDDPKPKEIPD